jgi:hypothetical protein
VGASATLLALRLFASVRVGFGDAEALYASYALHPQPAYLDHPGLIGAFARIIGEGTAPSPQRAHLITSALATVVPWAMVLACRACGATWRRAFAGGLVFALVPEIAIGLFAMTPDLLLALAWTGTLGLAASALRATPGSARAALGFASAGVVAGLGATSKATGALLMATLFVAYASPKARAHARTVAPWAGLTAGMLVIAPVVAFETRSGFPMLRHRLVDTQQGAGLSLRNVSALVGGQLAYLSPFGAWLAVKGVRDLWRHHSDSVGGLLCVSVAVPAAVLVPLALWSRIAEPHWIAPALLGLVPAMTRAKVAPSRSLVVATCALAGAISVAAHAWVLLPDSARLADRLSDPRFDLANELYGWPEVLAAVEIETLTQRLPGSQRGDVAVVGPHWVICAQLEAGLHGAAPVGCDTPMPDDFDRWWPRERWRAAESIVWVTDRRFGPPPVLTTHATLRTREVRIERAGRTARTFTIAVLTRRAQA